MSLEGIETEKLDNYLAQDDAGSRSSRTPPATSATWKFLISGSLENGQRTLAVNFGIMQIISTQVGGWETNSDIDADMLKQKSVT
jgi:hypothetical protein